MPTPTRSAQSRPGIDKHTQFAQLERKKKKHAHPHKNTFDLRAHGQFKLALHATLLRRSVAYDITKTLAQVLKFF